MAVTEALRALGSWGLQLSSGTPKKILDSLDYFGHIVVHTGRIDPRVDGDALLWSARYTGVYRGKSSNSNGFALKGTGMAFWLGDEEDKGDVIEGLTSFNTQTFASIIAALLPSAVHAGTINAVGTTYSFNFQYQSRRKLIDYVCQTVGADWRVNGDGTLDAGLESDLYRVLPRAALISKRSGVDMFSRALAGEISTDQDMEDFTTRTLLLANGTEASTATASADIAGGLNPYKDLYGNAVKLTRIISESETDTTNAQARAQLQLNRFSGSRDAISCSTGEFDLKGDVVVGDYMWVFAPDVGVYDLNNEFTFLGDRLYPMRLRLTQMSWPITEGMSVAFRDSDGVWIDLTPYFIPESGESQLVVGGYSRSLVGGQDGGPAGSRPVADTSIPGAPTWVTPFVNSVYQSPVDGDTKAQVNLKWTRPLNVDGSTILDGDHFEIRFRSSTTPIFPSTHAQMAVFTHAQLAAGTHEQPITYPPGPYQYTAAPWDQLTILLQDLPTNMPYEAQVRAVDNAKPANAGAWSSATVFQTSGDTLPPATPAPPTVAASVIAIQVTHQLGRSDGGTFNLDPDLHHLEVHGEYEPLFTPSESTLLGKLSANKGMLLSQTEVVGTFQIDSLFPVYFKVVAVDNDGNASPASTAVQTTALLVDDLHISSLTVSKITAGTITSDWIVGATIMSGTAGAGRVQMVPTGFEAYNPLNVKTVDIKTDGTILITGKFQTGVTGQRIVLDPFNWTGVAAIQLYDNSTTNYISLEAYSAVMALQARRLSDNAPNGGKFYMDLVNDGSGSVYMAYQNPSVDWFAQLASSGNFRLKGYFGKTETIGGLGGLYADQIGGSGTSASVTYGATMATTPLPFVDVQPTSGGAAGKYHCISARSTTGFTVEYPSGNYDIFVWAARVV